MGSRESADFDSFFETAEPRIRLALSGAFGLETGRDAAADALAWGWQHWSRLAAMENPVGYLYRIGRSSALRTVERRARAATARAPHDWPDPATVPDVEPRLVEFLTDLPERQRVAVWMVHGLGYTHREVADVLGCSTPTVATHVRRGLEHLRDRLEVGNGV